MLREFLWSVRAGGHGGNKHSEGWSAAGAAVKHARESGSPQGDGQSETEGNYGYGEKADVVFVLIVESC